MFMNLSKVFFTICVLYLAFSQEGAARTISECRQKCTDQANKDPSFNVQLCYVNCYHVDETESDSHVHSSVISKCFDECEKQGLSDPTFDQRSCISRCH